MSDHLVTALIDAETKIRVSSTLDPSVGKKYLTDGSPETCWTSAQGSPQFVHFSFASPVIPSELSITFQGGFAGTRCAVHVLQNSPQTTEWRLLSRLFPEDVNRRQKFSLSPGDPDANGVTQIKLVFEESSDFFGRITVYDVSLQGLQCVSRSGNS